MHYYQRLRDLREDADKKQADIAEILGELFRAGQIQMGTAVIGIGGVVQTDLLDVVQEIVVFQAVLFGICGDSLVPRSIPVVLFRIGRGFHQDEFHAVFLTEQAQLQTLPPSVLLTTTEKREIRYSVIPSKHPWAV